MSTMQAVGSIVTDGLVLHLDAANYKSYPGSGTTWTDLTINKNNGTLTNGPTFNSGNGGSIVFDGVDDYVSTTIGSLRNLTGSKSSVNVWFKIVNNTVRNIFIADWDTLGANETIRFEVSGYLMTSGKVGGTINSLGGTSTPIQSTTVISNNTWYNAVLLYDGTNTKLYLNGNLEATLTTTERGSNGPGSVSLGRAGAYNGLYMNGNISQVQVYNRALSAAEVLQNYNAVKRRFGIL